MKFCVFLMVACLLDAIFTQFGIIAGFVEEGNPIMKLVLEKGWTYFYLLKLFLPLTLLGLFLLQPFKGRVRMLLITTCGVYLSVLAYHMIWMILTFTPST